MQRLKRSPDLFEAPLEEWFFKEISKQSFFRRMNLEDSDLYIEAFTHKSFIHEYKIKKLRSYERLEFLGDSLIQLWVSGRLFHQYKSLDEGDLSKIRSSIVNEEFLATLFDLLEVSEFILLGKGEIKNKGFERSSLKCDVFESLVGAIYLSSSMGKVEQFLRLIEVLYKEKYHEEMISFDRINDFDPKTSLQELFMEHKKIIPTYHSEHLETGEYKVKLLVDNKSIGETIKKSKKQAEKELAKIALEEKLYLGESK